MGAIEAVLILIGVVFLVGSFFITEKLSPADVSRVAELSEEEIHMVVDRELKVAGAKVSDLVDDAMDLTVDKVQRTMERDTNEKIMAISEYSDSVMDKLEKMNHEVTFLYSMLGDKHTQINETIDQLGELIATYEFLRQQPLTQLQSQPEPVAEEEPPVVVQPPVQVQSEEPPEDTPVVEDTQTKEEESEPVSVREQILERYREGENLTDIARNLGLGLGEVKLIVDLYRGEGES